VVNGNIYKLSPPVFVTVTASGAFATPNIGALATRELITYGNMLYSIFVTLILEFMLELSRKLV
jgi:hypothetical protein